MEHGLGGKMKTSMGVCIVLTAFFLSAQPLIAQCTSDLSHERLQSVLWLQQSAEYKANAMQAYALATANLKTALGNLSKWPEAVRANSPAPKRGLAVILDVDETILDNTPAETMLIANNLRKFDKALWDSWEQKANARKIDGALEFVKYAVGQHVTVFYVTNRNDEQKLRQNLSAAQFPVSTAMDTVLMPGECSTGDKSTDKECRRQDIAKNYHVLMLIGDDFADFISLTGKGPNDRIRLARDSAERWGREWIILPNPSYGSWERAFYDSTKDDGDVILKKKLMALEQE
jgi:5'-nucleotidase (lipoprotein e(P4) family)